MDSFEILLRLTVALAIGLLIGVERAWHQRADQDSRAAGIRTFALSGLIGGVTGVIGLTLGPVFAGLAFLGYAAVLLAFQWREAVETDSVGATTAIAGLAVFLLGTFRDAEQFGEHDFTTQRYYDRVVAARMTW